jgi:hypothetical protein
MPPSTIFLAANVIYTDTTYAIKRQQAIHSTPPNYFYQKKA